MHYNTITKDIADTGDIIYMFAMKRNGYCIQLFII